MSQHDIDEIIRRLERIEHSLTDAAVTREKAVNLEKRVDSIDVRFWAILVASGGTMITTLVQLLIKFAA